MTAKSFFIWCAGSDEALLNRCSQKEQIKHAGMGALVLVPAVLGLFSMSYALSTLHDSPLVYLGGGLVWAAIVFAIDRFIVSTFTKRESIRKDFFSFQFFARALFAVGIGVLVSHPMVLLVFNDSLEQELVKMREEQEDELRSNYDTLAAVTRNRNTTLGQQLSDKEKERREWQQFLSFEISGVDTTMACCGATTGLRYYGPATKKIEDRIATLGNEIAVLRTGADSTVTNNNKEISAVQSKRDSALQTLRNTFSFDYVAREVALTRLEAREVGGSAVTYTKWFLLIFFIFVDILPVFLKVATERGEYDLRLESEKINIHVPYGYDRDQNEWVERNYIDRNTKLRVDEINREFDDYQPRSGKYSELKEHSKEYL